jgi:hypothetical protein
MRRDRVTAADALDVLNAQLSIPLIMQDSACSASQLSGSELSPMTDDALDHGERLVEVFSEFAAILN